PSNRISSRTCSLIAVGFLSSETSVLLNIVAALRLRGGTYKTGVTKLATNVLSAIRASTFKVSGMNDPTRLDEVLRAVKVAWAGQPDLSLPTLMAMAGTPGSGWGSSENGRTHDIEGRA